VIRTIFAMVAASVMLLLRPASTDAASIVTEWLDEVLPDAKEVAWEPTVGARFLAIVHTAMYDAWTAYDPLAVGSVTGRLLKGQGGADNEANKREAISHAAFTVLRAEKTVPTKRAISPTPRAMHIDNPARPTPGNPSKISDGRNCRRHRIGAA
jgi:hypothetical protein